MQSLQAVENAVSCSRRAKGLAACHLLAMLSEAKGTSQSMPGGSKGCDRRRDSWYAGCSRSSESDCAAAMQPGTDRRLQAWPPFGGRLPETASATPTPEFAVLLSSCPAASLAQGMFSRC